MSVPKSFWGGLRLSFYFRCCFTVHLVSDSVDIFILSFVANLPFAIPDGSVQLPLLPTFSALRNICIMDPFSLAIFFFPSWICVTIKEICLCAVYRFFIGILCISVSQRENPPSRRRCLPSLLSFASRWLKTYTSDKNHSCTWLNCEPLLWLKFWKGFIHVSGESGQAPGLLLREHSPWKYNIQLTGYVTYIDSPEIWHSHRKTVFVI